MGYRAGAVDMFCRELSANYAGGGMKTDLFKKRETKGIAKMTTINHNALESAQVYPDRFGRKGDVYYRLFCQRCGCLLPEGATEETELCKSCEEKKPNEI